MTSKIESYAAEKLSLDRAREWKAKLGSRYYGGGGGIGEIHSAWIEYTIYHQANDGDPNYHESGKYTNLSRWLCLAAKDLSPVVIERAFNLWEAHIVDLANAAKEEYKSIASDAGLQL